MVSPTEVETTVDSQGEVIMSQEIAAKNLTPLAYDDLGNVRVTVFFPDYNIQKCFTFDPDENVWEAKKMILDEVGDQLHDALNYGLYLPPSGGKAGKFLDEERPLEDYKLSGPVGQLDFKYKRRVYRMVNMNYRKLKTLHNKSTLKHVFDLVKSNSVEKVTRYVERGLDPNYIEHDSGETPLTAATKVSRCRSLILQLVSGGAHVDFRNRNTLTPVHTAALNGNAEALKALLELGASPNYKDSKSLTALYHLSKKRNAPALCAELLLRDYAQIGCKDDTGNTELHQACKVGNYKVAEMLIFYGAELDYQTSTGATPLHICASNNELHCLQTLLVRGADKSVMNHARQTPYDVAVVSGNKEAANILDKHDDLLVVPFEDSPVYNTNRRLAGANLEAMRLLSKSDPRINLSTSVMNLSIPEGSLSSGRIDSTLRSDLGHLGLYLSRHRMSISSSLTGSSINSGLFDSLSVSRAVLKRSISTRSGSQAPVTHIPNCLPGKVLVCSKDYHSTSPGQLYLNKGDRVTVISVGDNGMLEGKSGDREGWLPADRVSELRRRTINAGNGERNIGDETAAARQTGFNTMFSQDGSRNEGVRTVVLAKTKKGYGFVLRGAKADQLKKLNVKFVPSERMPALQYLDSVEKGSVSDKAGLKSGDFILEIDGVNVVQASHEQTVQIIKKAGDVLAMKVVKAVLPKDINGSVLNGRLDGTQTLPSRRSKSIEESSGHSSHKLMRKKSGSIENGSVNDEEALAIERGAVVVTEQLDATLANYDSDSKSSGSSAQIVPREQKVASIRQRPNSAHFTSIQELDDMFSPPSASINNQENSIGSSPAEPRKPAKSRVKKFWSKGKNNKLGSKKSLSLSQPNLAALDPEAKIKPITMYEMTVGHSIDGNEMTRVHNSQLPHTPTAQLGASEHHRGLPRTLSGDLASLQKSNRQTASPNDVLLPPPPSFPAPEAPADDRSSQHSGYSGHESSFRPGSFAQTNHVTDERLHHNGLSNTNKRFLPRTPLPVSNSLNEVHSSPSLSSTSTFSNQGGVNQRGKIPPPPPQRSTSHEPGALLATQGNVNHTAPVNGNPPLFPLPPPLPSAASDSEIASTTSSNSFANQIRKMAAERENAQEVTKDTTDKSSTGVTIGNELYAAVQKRQLRTNSNDSSGSTNSQGTKPDDSYNNAPISVEDQLRAAVAKRRTLMEQKDSTESDRSSSVTPENTLSPASNPISNKPTAAESTNFRELAEQKRQEFLKKKSENLSETLTSPAAPTMTNNKVSDELQRMMNKLAVSKGEEPNNNKKKPPPPMVMKKPGKTTIQTTAPEQLSPVEEFPPPPPPGDFVHSDLIIPPPTFGLDPPSQFSPPAMSPPVFSPKSEQVRHDTDNHSVSSSAGSDTISSVSQDGNRVSVATSGYSSDPNRSSRHHSGKNVELWSVAEVGEWLDSIGLGEYKVVFAENCIEGETLVSMSKSDIKELGVEKVGHRVKLDKEIKKLSPESVA